MMKKGGERMANELGITLKKLRESRNLSQYALAEKSGVPRSTIAGIERGANSSTPATINKLSEAMGLINGETQQLLNAFTGFTKGNVKFLDEEIIYLSVRAKASAGNGYMNFTKMNKKILVRKNGFDESCYLIEVEGDSMEPLIPDGAYIVVDPRYTEIQNNKIHVVCFEDEAYIKIVIRNEELGMIILKSINQKYDDIFITKDKLSELRLQGRCVKVIHEFNI